MNIEKIEELIKLMKQNQVNYMKYKDETVEVELDLKSTSNIVTTTPVNNVEESTPTSKQEEQLNSIEAEILGTFYLQDEETLQNPLVKVGDEVKKGQVVGYIESMKVLNEVISEYDGIVNDIQINHGDPVEYGQTIITLK
ncbi:MULTISPECIES: acetyl-CoA carboxylase biotin carboxyl carrier protein [Mammaliicoccus]|jgi:acetyl-CoA carboxylase biotin carboxyl carrier protein|uniref:Acetyl-CoA carboxylase biotin carboxyl carrier protein subunit n=1 Tax=Mammaliicoccus sciuri TaxID=1296 RepID=A0AAW5LNF4_MAMSC|nr:MULTISPECIES: biotin/lipoyl-containing protein [Mammaliicoccus]MBO1208350.1 acetyl-CoA carboxylase biotin carboxyl carrier protein subunit [Mammaliicoccus sciuri]MBU6088606.1 acetyl-CoA carboxylase biotin carboxyl carrier protein subunit [Mammaliicoccus sciuri]MBW3108183.1 acetyl-CoA carboxylase biotin carboxyl carrier protein subunit [Mammaliicoccus sciuri]MCD5141463.1 acetyl-CoA carboxylase biotin carboxyl carrier protein subunit [Mammaliicoccus sciuri]MCD8760491.1 acetyl-CoA carboxylase 